MTNHESNTIAKSFEEFKSSFFPMLSQHESHNIAKLGFEQVGANMADEAFNSLLSGNREEVS
jgi:hypothetical protein